MYLNNVLVRRGGEKRERGRLHQRVSVCWTAHIGGRNRRKGGRKMRIKGGEGKVGFERQNGQKSSRDYRVEGLQG